MYTYIICMNEKWHLLYVFFALTKVGGVTLSPFSELGKETGARLIPLMATVEFLCRHGGWLIGIYR
jgi:hypothetical protein